MSSPSSNDAPVPDLIQKLLAVQEQNAGFAIKDEQRGIKMLADCKRTNLEMERNRDQINPEEVVEAVLAQFEAPISVEVAPAATNARMVAPDDLEEERDEARRQRDELKMTHDAVVEKFGKEQKVYEQPNEARIKAVEKERDQLKAALEKKDKQLDQCQKYAREKMQNMQTEIDKLKKRLNLDTSSDSEHSKRPKRSNSSSDSTPPKRMKSPDIVTID